MSELRIENWTLPAADLGPDNPLPPLHTGKDIHLAVEAEAGVPEDMLRNMAYGRVPSILPYTMQDGYTRHREPRQFKVAVLENELLRAAFFLELGGRLWSLIHKPTGRELLDCNPVFQPANLALRNAWFSGGVEWNICTTGHWPLTCSPLFAARVMRPDGTPVLRLYEWERIRQVPFQIDAYLPAGSPVLFVRIDITNPHDHDTPVYWWSNIAVPETPETRVIVPAEAAFRFGYKGSGLGLIPVPRMEGIDFTYPTHLDHAADFFFHIPDDRIPWITALDGQGRGLIQTSTKRLKGRKLFLWGMNAGGRKWQEFLSEPGRAYIEIQAGLARTQMEHIPMPPGARWSWVEAYGYVEADPDSVHSSDWAAAQRSVQHALDALAPATTLDRELQQSTAWVDMPPLELFQRGSGWGALERLRRESAGEPPFCTEGLEFDDASLTEAQTPWLDLLRTGTLPSAQAQSQPKSYMVQDAWRDMLQRAIESGRCTHWLAWLHLGVMRYYIRDLDGAYQAWKTSLERTQTAWALRNLAVLAQEQGRMEDACNLYSKACHREPGLPQLAVECGQTMLDAGQERIWLELLEELPDSVRRVGRIRLLEAQAALRLNDLERVRRIFDERPVVDDLREGEISLSQLWFEFHERRLSAEEGIPVDDTLRARVRRECPVPQAFDFRMHVEAPPASE